MDPRDVRTPPPPAAAGAGDEPRDACIVREILVSVGLKEGDYEPAVVQQFLMLAYRYAGNVLVDALAYADHAGRGSSLEVDDVRLAIRSNATFYPQLPGREDLDTCQPMYSGDLEDLSPGTPSIALSQKEQTYESHAHVTTVKRRDQPPRHRAPRSNLQSVPAMPPSTLGIAPLLDAYFRRRFAAAGLVQESVPLDGGATTVHCWRFPPGASEDLPVLVLLHGFGPPATWQWFRQVGALSARFRLLVPNLLFFGGSRTSGKERSEARQAEAVAQLIRAVVPAGSGRVSVVGTSYGGFVAYHVARLLGAEAVERVVIASSDLLKGDADDRALLRRGGADRVEDVMLPRTPERMRRLMELAYHRPRRFAPGFVLRDIIQYLYTDNIEEKKELIKGITLGNKDKFQLTPLPQQVLVLWGEHDQIFPIEKAFEVTRQLGASARLEILKNTGHLPQEEDAKRFNEALLNFLLPSPSSSL